MDKTNYLLEKKFINIKAHPFHLVDNSPWPFLTGFGALFITFNGVMYMHSFVYSGYLLLFSILYLIFITGLWWRDIVREATFQGHHTKLVQKGLQLGMILFIISEILFFCSFFWAFFSNAFSPSIFIGSIWPPIGLQLFNPLEVPLLNTIILLFSGVTVTWAHYCMYIPLKKYYKQCLIALFFTILLGILFTFFQVIEYLEAPFSINSGIYGSIFFILTGFHGFHVLIGTIFLSVNLIRMFNLHFSSINHLGFQSAIWYWHFVDVVWIIVYFFYL